MLRSSLALALIALAAPAVASTYSAALSAPASGHIIARDINWACAGRSCEAATQESRPAVLCEALVKRAGRIDAFAVDGRAFTSSELDKCNGGVKPPATSSDAAR